MNIHKHPDNIIKYVEQAGKMEEDDVTIDNMCVIIAEIWNRLAKLSSKISVGK